MIGSVGLGLGSVGTAAEAGERAEPTFEDTQPYVASLLIDFTAAGSVNYPIPLRPGYLFVGTAFRLILSAVTGTATGNLTFKAGNDATHDNLISSTSVSSGTINGVSGFLPIAVASGTSPTSAQYIDAGTQQILQITLAPTGLTVCMGWVVVSGTWVKT